MSFQLTTGICSRLHQTASTDDGTFASQPVVQLLSVKMVETPKVPGNNVDRYRLIISDGEHFVQAMLATQLNHLVHDSLITRHSVVRIDSLTANNVKEKRLYIILQMTVLETVAEKIGTPTAFDTSSKDATPSSGTTPAPAKPAQVPQNAQQSNSGPRRPTYPIESLSPYQNNWTIKARVTQKSDIKRWSNQRGEGHLFNVTFMDETGEIRATAFNAASDELYDKLQEGKVYYVSKARVNLAKKKFSNVQNDYELSLEKHTEVEECRDASDVPAVKYSFVEIGKLNEVEKDSVVDVIGVVKETGDLGSITSSKTQKQIPKREIVIVDRSSNSVRMTLWGKQAEEWAHNDAPVVAFKGVRVGDFGGRSLSMMSSATLQVNPEIEDAYVLRGWYDAIGNAADFKSQSTGGGGGGSSGPINRAELRTLLDVKDSQIGLGDKPAYFSAQATIVHIRAEPLTYPGCPAETCNKKVTQIGESWRCEKCDRSYDKPEHRYMMSFAVEDHTGQAWLQGFNEVGVKIFGMTANELNEIREADEGKFNVVMHKANCSMYNFSCRAKQDNWNEQTRVRYGVSRIEKLDFLEEARYLSELLQTPWAN